MSTAMPAALGLSHISLRVGDLRAMEGFYRGLLGFEVQWRPDGDTTVLALGNAELHLCRDVLIAPRGALRGLGLAYPSSAAVDVACGVLDAVGVRILEAPAQLPSGVYRAVVADPEGNAVELRCATSAVDGR